MLDPLSVALLILGFPLGRTRVKRYTTQLSKFLVYVVAPVLGFWAGLEIGKLWIAALATLPELAVFYLSRLTVEGCEKKGAIGITSAFGNTIFLGIPIVLSISGNVDAAVVYAMATTFIHYTLADVHACKKGKIKFQPFTVTFLIGILISGYKSLFMKYVWTKTLAAEMSKLGLLVLGLSFERQHLRLKKDVLRVGMFKHVLLPLLTLPFALLMSEVSSMKSLISESSMPPAFMNIALAYVYGYDVDLVTASVITLTLLWLVAFTLLYLFEFLFYHL